MVRLAWFLPASPPLDHQERLIDLALRAHPNQRLSGCEMVYILPSITDIRGPVRTAPVSPPTACS